MPDLPLRTGRACALILLAAQALAGQGTQTCSIDGEVIDGARRPLAGVTVRVTSPSLQGVRTAVSDARGAFHFPLLPPGTYTLVLTGPGLAAVRTTRAIGLGQSFEPRFRMLPAGEAQVEVEASSLDRSDMKSASNYSAGALDRLPGGRTPEAAALLTPGVTTVAGGLDIRGSLPTGTLNLMDGQNIADNMFNTRGIRIIDDAVEEVQVLTGGLSAEYGDTEGGVLNSLTRSGSNTFQGQLRWELSNPAWNAYQPMQDRTALVNRLGEERTLSLSGYLVKDRLWFAGSFFGTERTSAGTIAAFIPANSNPNGGASPNAPGGYGAPYAAGSKEIRRQVKLTWAIHPDHQLVAAFVNSRDDQANRNYNAGEVRALVPQVTRSEFGNLQWRALWTSTLVTEFKVGRKKQLLSAGATVKDLSPIFNYASGAFYSNGIFNSGDGGDNRNNRTANLKASLVWDGAGSHRTDAGVDHYEGIYRARNDQSVTGYIFGVLRMDLNSRTALPMDVWTYESTPGEARSTSQGLYLNDRWSPDPRFTFNLGLRHDRFRSQDEAGRRSAGAGGWSPRLGLKWDLAADGRFLAGASFARYNARVLEMITGAVTSQGNPTEVDHPWMGARAVTTFAALSDLSRVRTNYDFDTITYYNNPRVNVRLSDGLRAPTVDEALLSLLWSFKHPDLGEGFLRLTGVHKKWNDLFDYRIGNDGTVRTPDGADVYVKVMENSRLALHSYRGLELEGQLARRTWQLGGSVTWSREWGNTENANGSGLGNFTVQDGVRMYDAAITSPSGLLAGHVPLRIRGTFDHLSPNRWGRTTLGLVYRFDAGRRLSITRGIDASALNPGLSPQFGDRSAQYLGPRGGGGTLPGQAYLDLALTHDFDLFRVLHRPVTAFLKVAIANVWNHQQIIKYNNTWTDAYGQGLDAPWTPTDPARFGRPQSNTDYGTARTVTVGTGFRF